MSVAEAIQSVRHRVQAAIESSGAVQKVTLVAVSKTHRSAAVMEAYGEGVRDFGENYLDELVKKAAELPSDIRWHFIGNLQSNKSAQLAGVPGLFMWQTCSSLKTARLVQRAREKLDPHSRPLLFLIQVNTSLEPNKKGVAPNDCISLISSIREECPLLNFAGLMTIGSVAHSQIKPNPDFDVLARCKQDVCKHFGFDPAEVGLSMGMSSDFEHAIEMGSTCVRVGSTIFGNRDYSV